jgi:hypothetical protein
VNPNVHGAPCYDEYVPEPSNLCAYCVTSVLTGKEKPEHVIPASLGASLSVPTVCNACNEWAGREIDQPFIADQLLQAHRSLAGQLDPRRGRKARRTPSPLLRGHTADGDFIMFDPEAGRPVKRARIVELGEDRHQIRAGSQADANRLIERMRKRAASEGKEIRIEQEEQSEFQPTINVNMTVRTDVWRREAAKIALAIGSFVYPPTWRLSEDAQRLREWMHNRDSSTDSGEAPPLVPTHIPHGSWLAENDEHLLFFMYLEDGVYVCVCLFGSSYFAVPVDTSEMIVPPQAWRLDWHKPSKDGSTTWDALLTDAVKRRIDAQTASTG